MKDDFANLFAFNRWADGKVLDAVRQLTPPQYAAEPVPGWSSIRSTVAHIAIVTDGWIGGLAGRTADDGPSESSLATPDDAQRLLDRAYQTLDELLPALTPERLATPQLLRRGSRSATLPPWAVLRHVVNHASYHRGQIASKLKRFGVEQPATDLIFWVMEQQGKG
jgi:uncharacterized damage-inducible protein DinB